MKPLSDFEKQAIATIAINDPQREIVMAQLASAMCASRDLKAATLAA